MKSLPNCLKWPELWSKKRLLVEADIRNLCIDWSYGGQTLYRLHLQTIRNVDDWLLGLRSVNSLYTWSISCTFVEEIINWLYSFVIPDQQIVQLSIVWSISRSKYISDQLLYNIYFWSISRTDIATLGPSWNFSLTENLASISLQDGPRSGTIITQPASQPASRPGTLIFV